MRWVWTMRVMLLLTITVAILENAGDIRPPSGWIALLIVVGTLVLNFLVVARSARKNRR